MLKQRVISATIAIPILIVVVVAGGGWYDAVLGVVLFAATAEFLATAGASTRDPLTWLSALLAGVLPLAVRGGLDWPVALLAAYLLLSLAWLVVAGFVGSELRGWLLSAGIAIYIGWLGMHLALLRHVPDGRAWVFLALGSTFASDSGAYAVGRLAGRHRLAPRISPSKTIEGSVGGLVAAAIASVLLNLLLGPSEPLWLMVLIGLGASVVAQIGDLAESALKRALEVKDAGGLVPGHGGLLDRLDSLLFVGAVLYYVVRWIRL